MKLPRSQKGFVPIIVLLVLVLFVGTAGAGYWYLSKQKSTNSESTNPTQTQNQAQNLPNVPVYPGAKFTKQKFVPDCPGEQAVCNVDSWEWESSAKQEDVVAWYTQGQGSWKLIGGGGEVGTSRYGEVSDGKISYWLTIYNNNPTKIEFRGPLSN